MINTMDMKIIKYFAIPIVSALAILPVEVNYVSTVSRAEKEAVQTSTYKDFLNSRRFLAFDRDKDGKIEEILEINLQGTQVHRDGESQFDEIKDTHFCS